jgi:hypothetical protein
MFMKLWLAVAFLTVAAYYAAHGLSEMQKAVSLYQQDGSDDGTKL